MSIFSKRITNPLLLFVLVTATLVTPVAAQPSGQPAVAPDEQALAKIEPLVLQELGTLNQSEYFIWMSEKADLSPAYQLETKLEKGQFVYQTLVETAERTQKELRALLDQQGFDYKPYYISNKILILNGDHDLLMDVAARPDVAKITANHQFQLEEPFVDRDPPPHILAVEPNISFVNADDVWAMGYDGSGTVMAGNDTGLDETHPTVAPHYRGCLDPPTCSSWNHNYNWWDATNTYPNDPDDGHGHGTHTTGTMVGDDGGTNQIGMAPGAQTVHCKNMTDSGSGSDQTFTDCFQWDLAPWDLNGDNPDPALAPDAINNSWGYSGGNAPQFRDEIAALQAAGILVEVSAGNEGPSCTTLRSPGDYQEVLTTGSVDHIGQTFPGIITVEAFWSTSRGPSDLDGNYFPDVMAPGNGIRSCLPGNSYASWGGTSMAGPHATALVGLMWSACPTLQGRVTDTMQIIIDTAAPLSGQFGSNCGGDYTDGPNNDWGHGTIDALAAVNAALAQCTAQGHLDGNVYDDDTLAPIENADVLAEWDGGGAWNDATDVSGYYTMTLPNGTYTVTASTFGYLAETVTGVGITTDTVTSQDFYLTPAPEYVISGTVSESGTGLPLLAEIEVLNTPLSSTWTDPGTGYYSLTVPGGTYTLRASADLHQPEERAVVADQDQTQNFALDPLPCILLVDDDDNDPDVRPYYTAALDSLGYDYDVFDVGGGGGNGPSFWEMAGYSMVIWFSGDKWGGSAGPNGTDEGNLAAYLDGGGRLFLSSQDYLYDMDLTPFGTDYLGIDSYTNDTGGASSKVGVAGDPIGDGLGPYPLSYPFYDYGDIVNPDGTASLAFESQSGTNLDVDKDGGAWKTVFFGTSWVGVQNASSANGEELMDRIITWFGGCGDCEPITWVDFDWLPLNPQTGETVTFTASYHPPTATTPITFEWGFGDGSGTTTGNPVYHSYTTSDTYSVSLTGTNECGGPVWMSHDVVVTGEPICVEVTGVDLSLLTTGDIYTDTLVQFEGDVIPDDATKPYTYTIDYGDGSPPVQDTSSDDPYLFNHTFANTGTYTVTFAAWNCDMMVPVTGTVQVIVSPPACEPITWVDFDWLPLNPQTGETVTFTASYHPPTATHPISFEWGFGDGGGPTTGNPVYHSYTTSDTYSVSLTGTNECGGPVWMSHDVVVTGEPICVEVTGVDLSQLTTGDIYPGDQVNFSADIMPNNATKPYTYTLNYGDGSPPVQDTSNDDPYLFNHTFANTGTYTVTFAAWNCDMTVPVIDTVQVIVSPEPCEPITWVDFDWLPLNPQTGETVTFTASYQPLTATTPISFEWGFGDGSGPTTGNPVYHSYTTSDTYSVSLTGTNECGGPVWMSHDVVITGSPVCTEVTRVELNLLTTGDIYTDTLVQFEGDVMPNDATKPYTYTIDYGDGNVDSGLGSADPYPFDYTYANTGTYTVQFWAWNCDMTQPMTDTVEITVMAKPITECVEVESVELNLLTTGDIYTDTLVRFEGDVVPDDATKPYTYTIDYGDGNVDSGLGSADPYPFDYTYANTGTYTVQFWAWNCDMTQPMTDAVEITVMAKPITECVEVESVELNLLTTGDIYTDTLVQFEGDVVPDDATKPYTYTIDYGDGNADSGLGSADPYPFDYTYANTGTYTVQFWAWNCDMTQPMTDAVEITVMAKPITECVEVASVDLSLLTMSTIHAGELVNFRAEISPNDATKPYTYVIDYGDSNTDSGTSSDDPYQFSYTYTVTGTYTAQFWAWNCDMTQPMTDTVEITVEKARHMIYLPIIVKD